MIDVGAETQKGQRKPAPPLQADASAADADAAMMTDHDAAMPVIVADDRAVTVSVAIAGTTPIAAVIVSAAVAPISLVASIASPLVAPIAAAIVPIALAALIAAARGARVLPATVAALVGLLRPRLVTAPAILRHGPGGHAGNDC